MQFIVYQDKYDVEVEWVFHLISIIIADNDVQDCFLFLSLLYIIVIIIRKVNIKMMMAMTNMI